MIDGDLEINCNEYVNLTSMSKFPEKFDQISNAITLNNHTPTHILCSLLVAKFIEDCRKITEVHEVLRSNLCMRTIRSKLKWREGIQYYLL